MSELPSHNSIEEIKRIIIGMATDVWESSNRVLMLARIGQALRQRGINLKDELRGEKLAEFISRELASDVRLLTSPSDPLTKGVVPANATIQSDTAAYFRRPDIATIRSDHWLEFNKQTWDAFSHSIPANCVRTVSLEPEIAFHDIEKGTEKPGQLSVPAEYIVSDSTQPKNERVPRIHDNILRWKGEHGIDLEKLKATTKNTNSVLSILLGALDKNDLPRISIPLDIIAKLQSAKLK
jgi:hypothetical protein